MENNQEARTGGKHQNFWKKNIYTLIISIKEQLWRVFKLNFDFLSFLRLDIYCLVFSRESDSTITNVRTSVCHKSKPLNSLKSSSFIIHPSSFCIHPSSFILHPSSFILHHSSFILHHSSFILPSFRDF